MSVKGASWILDFLLRLLEGSLRAWPSVTTLLLANLVPLAGVFWFGWNAGTLLFLYWAETAIVGAYTLPKLAVVSRWLALVYIPVTTVALVVITTMHGVFALTLPLYFADPGAAITNDRLAAYFREMAWPVALFAVSHGVSFVYHFLAGGEFRRLESEEVAKAYFHRVGVSGLSQFLDHYVLGS